MKTKNMYRFIILIIAASFFTMCASTPKFSARDSDNQKQFVIKKGDLFKVELEAQLSTGYGWQISSISGAEQYGQTKVDTAQSDMTGGRDMQYMIFRATNTGNGYIELKYVQPWKATDTPLKYYKIYITVQ